MFSFSFFAIFFFSFCIFFLLNFSSPREFALFFVNFFGACFVFTGCFLLTRRTPPRARVRDECVVERRYVFRAIRLPHPSEY